LQFEPEAAAAGRRMPVGDIAERRRRHRLDTTTPRDDTSPSTTRRQRCTTRIRMTPPIDRR
jgi:hypothetical protein